MRCFNTNAACRSRPTTEQPLLKKSKEFAINDPCNKMGVGWKKSIATGHRRKVLDELVERTSKKCKEIDQVSILHFIIPEWYNSNLTEIGLVQNSKNSILLDLLIEDELNIHWIFSLAKSKKMMSLA